MPEIPEVQALAERVGERLVGARFVRATALSFSALKTVSPGPHELEGRTLTQTGRRGKFLILELDGDRAVVNPMLTGRFQLAAPEARQPTKTAVVLGFGPRSGGPSDAAPWTSGAAWIPEDTASSEVRYRDPTQMGKVYLLPAGVERSVPGMGEEEQGPDADDAELTLDVWRGRIRRHPGELKNLLRNQAFVAGIGNAYSDEILHAARLLPFRKRSSLASEEIDELYAATGSTLARAVDILRARVPPTFEQQVRDFLAVHMKGGQPCPRCGTKISEVKAGGFVTSYCRGCQR